jgi:LmbE family N-acetylglucosaminyl deacetylase
VADLLIVGAHALDAEVMAGGLAASAAAGGLDVVLVHLTRGERGHPWKPPGEFGAQLEVEMQDAAAVLGVRCEWPGLNAPLDRDEACRALEQAFDRSRPRAVVTHWRGSWHPSHVRAHEAVDAVAQARKVTVLFGENCEDLDGFRAERFVSIENVRERWLGALRKYELFRLSEPGSGHADAVVPYWAYYTAAARVRGLQADLEFAQALMLGTGTPPGHLGLTVSPGVRH